MTDTSITGETAKAGEEQAQDATTAATVLPTTSEAKPEAAAAEVHESAPAPPTTMSAGSPPLTPQLQSGSETVAPPEPQVNLPSHEESETPSLPPRPDGDEEPSVSPEVAGLLAMFPDFDPTVLQSVLESVDGNQDRAIDTLLSMSDPSYVQETQPVQEQRSQTDLDEEFARNLLLEDQQQERLQQQYYQQYAQGGQAGQWNPQQNAYPQQQRRSSGGVGNKDTMAEVQEQFKQLAESGKKTFSSLVTKVKAKMQEFDQNRNQGSSSSYQPPSQPPPQSSQHFPPASWEAGGAGGRITTAQAQQPSWPPAETQYGSAAVAPQPQYFDQESFPQEQTQGYDISEPAVSSQPQPAASPRPPSRGAAPPPAPAANIDASKLGLLPKKPVSLLSGNTSAGSPRGDEDDDELDYVENPFEEHPGRK